jgi:hypothetical protein
VNLEEMLAKATAELEVAEADYLAAQQRLNDLRTMQDGLRLAQERYGATPDEAPNREQAPAEAANAAGPAIEPAPAMTGDAASSVPSVPKPAPAADAQLPGGAGDEGSRSRTSGRTGRGSKRRPAKRRPPQVSQTELAAKILREAPDRTGSNAHIRGRMAELGHSFDAEQVRAALAYLKRRERVVSVAPGVWQLVEAEPAAAAPALHPMLNGSSADHA